MGPLSGTRVIEMAGIGPGPFAGMMLADMGAEVLRMYRADQPPLILDASRARSVALPARSRPFTDRQPEV